MKTALQYLREHEGQVFVLTLFANGLSAKEIEAQYGVNRRTAEAIATRYCSRLMCRNKTHLISVLIKHGVIKTENIHIKTININNEKATIAYPFGN